MKELTGDELRTLKWGQKVFRFSHGKGRSLSFVGVNPTSENMLIFADGSYIETLYVSSKDNTFSGTWYIGTVDRVFIGHKIIEYLEKEKELVSRIYIKEY